MGIGATYIIFGDLILERGVRESMAPAGGAEGALSSPLLADANWWVYTHVGDLGLFMVILGILVESERLRQWITRPLIGAHIYYGILIFSASVSPMGEGFYEGPGALAPPILITIFTLLFTHVALCERGVE